MAGSFDMVATKDARFKGISMIENLGDAYEALEECVDMIRFLSDENPGLIKWAQKKHLAKRYPHHPDPGPRPA